MKDRPDPGARARLARAHAQMVEALDILDEVRAPGDIGSLLDLAIVRLEAALGLEQPASASPEALLARLGGEISGAEAEPADPPTPWDISPA